MVFWLHAFAEESARFCREEEDMAQAQNGDKVQVHYTGTLADGTVFDSSLNREPLEFTIGGGQMIPGFDTAVNGMEVGESVKVEIPSSEAYGSHSQERVIQVDRSQMPGDMPVEVGVQVQGSQPNGSIVQFTVTEVAADTVTLDGNHPLAGKDLTFEIELVAIA
jgi:FKBP-type peptidyl-prolyl cis-trans isomerase 2